MSVALYEHQKEAIEQLRSGSILFSGVGSGKSRIGVGYYYLKECCGKIKINGVGGFSPMKHPKDLYIITTAKKRDSLDFSKECAMFRISRERDASVSGVKVTVDSWNNIKKYIDVEDAFFIFDEQRLIGAGTWVKAFLKIVKKNRWILMSATPADHWMDYVPVFIANGFYKNRTQFIKRHVIYNRYSRFPKIDRFLETNILNKYRKQITVHVKYKTHTIAHDKEIIVSFDKEMFDKVLIKRWNIYNESPIKNISELGYVLRKVVNSDPSRLEAIKNILTNNKKVIIFYNFNYELDILRTLKDLKIPIAEWNGHKHEEIPNTESWIYLVQYTAGCEGWNCVETNIFISYSLNHSYRVTKQAKGRIDRLNTPFSNLYYYFIRSNSIIDLCIKKTLKKKQNFNMNNFMDF
jgi:hypothetical protein